VFVTEINRRLPPETAPARGQELVDEDDLNAFAGVLVIELDPVIVGQMRHDSPLAQNADARAERPASMVTTEPLV
jgi:hypothetical protein